MAKVRQIFMRPIFFQRAPPSHGLKPTLNPTQMSAARREELLAERRETSNPGPIQLAKDIEAHNLMDGTGARGDRTARSAKSRT